MKIAIVGATGLVGSNIIQLCEKNFNPEVEYTLFASKSSDGKKVTISNRESVSYTHLTLPTIYSV